MRTEPLALLPINVQMYVRLIRWPIAMVLLYSEHVPLASVGNPTATIYIRVHTPTPLPSATQRREKKQINTRISHVVGVVGSAVVGNIVDGVDGEVQT